MSKTEKKIRHLYLQKLAAICKLVPIDRPMTKDDFSAMWKANDFFVYSSKYSHKCYNSASLLIEEHYLRPIGLANGFLNDK